MVGRNLANSSIRCVTPFRSCLSSFDKAARDCGTWPHHVLGVVHWSENYSPFSAIGLFDAGVFFVTGNVNQAWLVIHSRARLSEENVPK